MLNINLNNVRSNISASANNKKEAYEKLKSFKEKNEQLKAVYVAKGQKQVKISL